MRYWILVGRKITCVKMIAMALGLVLTVSCAIPIAKERESTDEFDLKSDAVGINTIDATKRIAIIFPNGNVCSEISPPAVINRSSAESLGASDTYNGLQANLDAAANSSKSAVRLNSSSERVECLRISMFHACGLISSEGFSSHDSAKLYSNIIKDCGTWIPPAPATANIESTESTESTAKTNLTNSEEK